jgi:hypothetical protein
MKTIILTVILLGFCGGPASAIELTLDDDFPMVGIDQIVTVTGVERAESLRLWVIYSPNSETQTEEEIGRFSSGGAMTWNPTRFGIATLSARDDQGGVVATENVAILFAKTPKAGVLVMLFAGVLLFGGAAFSLRSVLRSGVPEQLPPIDT